jgi:hypothetical protein
MLTWNKVVGITLAGFILMVYLRGRSLLSTVLSLFNLPLVWILFLGQLDGVITAGLLALPYSLPIVLLKPQVTIFAIFSRRIYAVYFVLFMLASFVTYGLWPISFFRLSESPNLAGADQNISLGLWALPIVLIGLWFSRGDMDMMMLVGLAALPYVIPYHFLPATPSIARLRPWAAVTAVTVSWFPLSANWIGPVGWKLGWVFIVWLWLNLAIQRYPNFVLFRKVSKWFNH